MEIDNKYKKLTGKNLFNTFKDNFMKNMLEKLELFYLRDLDQPQGNEAVKKCVELLLEKDPSTWFDDIEGIINDLTITTELKVEIDTFGAEGCGC